MISTELDARKADFIRKLLNDINEEPEMKRLEQMMKKITETRGKGGPIAPMMTITQGQLELKVKRALEDNDVITDEETTRFYIRWATGK